jgi:predicted esterase
VLPHVAGKHVIGKPALILHGEHDQKLGVNLARWARGQLEQLAVTLSYRELAIGHELSASEREFGVDLANHGARARARTLLNATDNRVESAA